MKRQFCIFACVCAFLIGVCAHVHAALPGTTCATAIPLGDNYSAPISGAKTVWYTAWTFDLPLTVTFTPTNPTDPAPDVEMDFTCTPGVYADDILCSLFCQTGGSGIEFDMPHHPSLSSKTENGKKVYYLAMGKSYRDLLLKTGIDYNVQVYVKVTYKSAGVISLAPDESFANCMDGHKFMHLGDTVQVNALDKDRHVIVPYVQWQEDSIRYVWNGTAPVTLAVGYACSYDPTDNADETILDLYTLQPQDTLKLTSAEVKHYVKEANSEAGMFYAKFYSTGTGTMKIERVPMDPPQGGATLLRYDKTTPVAANDTNALYAIPYTWTTATKFTTPTDHIFKMYIGTTYDFYTTDAIATYQFSKNDNGHWLGLTDEQMQALWTHTTEQYLYVRFECTSKTTIKPIEWDIPTCFTGNTVGGEIKRPSATISVEKGSYGAKYYRFYYREWCGGDMLFKWTNSTGNCPTFIGKNCSFTANRYDDNVLDNKAIAKNGSWTVTADDLAEWENDVDEDGYLYIRFNPGNPGTMTISTTAPEETDPLCNPYDSILTVSAWDSYIWRGTTYATGGVYSEDGSVNAVTGCIDTIYTLRLTIKTTNYDNYEQTACGSIIYRDRTYTQSGEYTDTIYDAMGNRTIMTLNLTVNNPTSSDTTATSCGGMEWRGKWYDVSGDYSDTLVNAAGCDSIRTLHLTVNHPTSSDTTATSCGGMEWRGKWYDVSGDYSDTLINVAGCDSIRTLHLTIVPSYTITLPDIKACDSYVWGDTTIYDSGTYTRRFTTVHGCDSVVTRTITIGHSYLNVVDKITAYDSYTWIDGRTYTSSISAPAWGLSTVDDCDSLITLNLTIRHLEKDTFTRTLCETELPYEWYGKFYHESGIYSSDTIKGKAVGGVYVDTVHIVNLTVLPVTTGDTTATACKSFTWYGTPLTASGDYTHKLTNAAGCDSTVTLHLTILQPTMGDTTATACNSFTWYGAPLTASGDYTRQLTNAASCDSTVTLHLTIRHPTTGDTTATACNSFTWYGTPLTASGDYTRQLTSTGGCDSTVTLHLTINHPSSGEETKEACVSYLWHGHSYTESGIYQTTLTNAAGCDSTATLHLTINDCAFDYDTVYFCTGLNTEHEEYLGDGLARRYLAYAYESPAEWDYMEGVIVTREHDRMLVDLIRAEQNIRNHYVDGLTPVKSIVWSYRPEGETSYVPLTVSNDPQWVTTGVVALTVRFVCGQMYTGDFATDIMSVGYDQLEIGGRKVLENGQIVIIRGDSKYTVLGNKIH